MNDTLVSLVNRSVSFFEETSFIWCALGNLNRCFLSPFHDMHPIIFMHFFYNNSWCVIRVIHNTVFFCMMLLLSYLLRRSESIKVLVFEEKVSPWVNKISFHVAFQLSCVMLTLGFYLFAVRNLLKRMYCTINCVRTMKRTILGTSGKNALKHLSLWPQWDVF